MTRAFIMPEGGSKLPRLVLCEPLGLARACHPRPSPPTGCLVYFPLIFKAFAISLDSLPCRLSSRFSLAFFRVRTLLWHSVGQVHPSLNCNACRRTLHMLPSIRLQAAAALRRLYGLRGRTSCNSNIQQSRGPVRHHFSCIRHPQVLPCELPSVVFRVAAARDLFVPASSPRVQHVRVAGGTWRRWRSGSHASGPASKCWEQAPRSVARAPNDRKGCL